MDQLPRLKDEITPTEEFFYGTTMSHLSYAERIVAVAHRACQEQIHEELLREQNPLLKELWAEYQVALALVRN